MKKILVIALLVVLSGMSVKYLKNNGESYILTEQYTVSFAHYLTKKALINNIYSVSLFPEVQVNGETVPLTLFTEHSQNAFSDKIVYTGMQIEDEVEYLTTIEFKEDIIISRLRVRNLGVDTKSFKIIYNISSKDSFIVFYPSLYYGVEKNYVVFTQRDLKGISLGIKFNFPITQENFQKTFTFSKKNKTIVFKFDNLKNNEKFEIDAVFVPFCIGDAELRNPEYTCLLRNEKLFDLPISADIIGNSQGVITVTQKTNIGSETFTDFKNPSGTLQRALYGKAACINSRLPCRLFIGEKNGGYVAWLAVLDNGWKEIDLYKQSYGRPSVERIIYEEPVMKYVGALKGNDYTEFTKITSWVENAGEKNLFLPIVFTIIVVIVIVYLINRYGRKYIEYLGSESPITRVYLDGKYKILKEVDEDNIVLKEVFEWIKKNDGEINIKKMVSELKYSDEIIKSWITYLIKNNYIKK